jgi:hypothetical protein
MIKHIDRAEQQNKINTRHQVRKVRPDLNSYYNSVNLLTGAQGGGKAFAAMNEILTISRIPETHLIIYIHNKAYDPTVEDIKDLAMVPAVSLDCEEAEDCIANLYYHKQIYNRAKMSAYEQGLSNEELLVLYDAEGSCCLN